MPKTTKLAIALAATALAVPALAGNSWPQGPSGNVKATAVKVTPTAKADARGTAPRSGFAYRGEGVGWEPSQHMYVLTASGLAHSNECDHAMRPAPAMSAEAIEAARKQYPGG